MYRHDRINSVGGGVLLYVHESLPAVMCESLMNCQIDDSLWCVTTLPNSSKFIGIVYRSPLSIEANDSKLVNILATYANFRIALISLQWVILMFQILTGRNVCVYATIVLLKV